MKKLQIPLDDELMIEAKLYAFQNGTTLKEIVTNAIKSYITTTTTITGSTTNTSSTIIKDTISNISNTSSKTTTSSTKLTFEEMYGYDDSDATEEELEEARATTVYVDEAPIPVYIEETPIISTYDNRPLSLDDLVPEKPKPKKESKYR